MEVVIGLFSITIAAVLGGILAKFLRLPTLVGYILAGVVFGALLPPGLKSVSSLAEIGTILLLFSIGIELSLSRLGKFLNIAVFGGLIQIALVTGVSFLILKVFGFEFLPSLILSFGFSISSTAVMVKILSDRGEMDTIHGGIMFSWSLVQDLAVIPFIVVLPILAGNWGGLAPIGFALAKAAAVIAVTLVLGRLLIPLLIHKVADSNSRELMLLASVALAFGTAGMTSFFGISPALGAFLAGVVISESQEHHAIFAETRPLRDLFVALFFVTLGFMVNLPMVFGKLPLVLLIAASVIILKIVVVFILSAIFDYRGKSAVSVSFGLAQVGEFAFVIFSTAAALNLISPADTTLGIAVALTTLIVSPIIYGNVLVIWRWLRKISTDSAFAKLFATGEKKEPAIPLMENHIIICGYGRVGKWVGKAMTDLGIPFVVVEYNQNVVNELKGGGISVLYGDPTEPEILEAVGIRNAKAVILAIPDRVAQETLIAYVQTVAPEVKIISRAHLDEDWDKLKNLRVDKVVQPEFEAAVEIVRSVLISRGKTKDEIREAIKSLRVSHSK